jgi:carbonic anhydrase
MFPSQRRFAWMPLCLALLAGQWCAPVLADEWQLVMRDRDRRVEIDRASIIQSDAGTRVAWGRVVMSRDEAARAGYTTIKALNRYDCNNRGFVTVKRVYLDAENRVLREETVIDQSVVMVARNSVDERLWREVCRPPTVADLAKVADQADRAAQAAVQATPPVRAEVNQAVRRAEFAAPAAAPTPDPIERTIAARSAPPAGAPSAGRTPSAVAPAQVASVSPSGAAAPRAAVAPPARAAVAPSQAAGAAQAAAKAVEPAWSYQGARGPEAWGRLQPDWALCANGARQSPLDLRDGIPLELEPVRFDYRSSRYRVIDTPHTLSVRIGEGMGIEVRGERYGLESFQFHRPSEIRVDGRAADMAIHFHHRAVDGRLAVLVVQLVRGEAANPVVQRILNNVPLERGAHYMPSESIDLEALLPADPGHYLFMGSLSQPPCTEGVVWVVMKQPLTVSVGQLMIFARLYESNARPVQPLNDRLVLESR